MMYVASYCYQLINIMGADVRSPLELSVRSAGSEFQIVGAAWQNAQLPKNSPGPSIVRERREV